MAELKHDLKGVIETPSKEVKEAPKTTESAADVEKAKLMAMEQELKALEIAAKKLELQEKEANLQDLKERLEERELKRVDKGQRSKINGQTIRQTNDAEKAHQARCNHRKGGNGASGYVGGNGDDSQYAVIKHIFANGDTWIRCLRCGKTWKPVRKEWFNTIEEYIAAVTEYQTALNFQTRNATSSSVPFRFSDNGEYYREVTRGATLR